MQSVIFALAIVWSIITMCASQDNELVYHVLESNATSLYVGNLSSDSYLANDFSDNELRQLTFAFLSPDATYAMYFNVSNSLGIIKTNSSIDRESLCPYTPICVINVDIAVQSTTTGLFFEIIRVKIIVDDANDNTPKFPQSDISLSIQESMTVGKTYQIWGAEDSDVGPNSALEYTLVPRQSEFGLIELKKLDGNSDLSIVLNSTLDRETKDTYQILVLAKDGGSPQNTGTMTVNIQILDANDNHPVFSNSTYDASVKETAPTNTLVLDLNATDKDIGINSEILYQFSSRTSVDIMRLFSLNEHTGILRVAAQINYEDGHAYEFVVEASDRGTPKRASQAKVTINIVKDNRNNRPKIKINTLSHSKVAVLSEDVNPGRFVAHVAVEDTDAGRNGDVSCSINSDMFVLEPLYSNEYTVIVAGLLDREAHPEYDIVVTCADGGDPPMETMETFQVKLTDINDHVPEFTTSNYMAHLSENNAIGDPVAQVAASDPDLGPNGTVTYTLHPDAGNLFLIQEKTGIILANTEFDREATAEVRFHVIASDHGPTPLTSTTNVVVSITDINDNYPTFGNKTRFAVSENMEPGSPVGILTATDKDSGSNGIVTFEMAAASSHFVVESDGTITSSAAFDRETQAQFELIVVARDYGHPALSSEAAVSIVVIDANDNRPKITFPTQNNNTFEVPYQTAPNTIITRIRAEDMDAGLNGDLLFSLAQGNNKRLFNIDTRSGYISVVRKMELKDAGSYKLIAAVEDQGNPKKTSWVNLNILITIANDTSLSSGHGLLSDENTTIVIVLAVVTVVLSAFIIITICIIKRIDKKKHSYRAKNREQKVASSMMSQIENSSRSAIQRGGSPRKPKEVSFSLQDDSASAASSSSLRAPPPTYDTSIDTNSLEAPRASSSLLSNKVNVQDNVQATNQPSPVTVKLTSGQNPVKAWFSSGKYSVPSHMVGDAEKSVVDSQSDTTTSDSGNGGSEDDVTSHRQYPTSETGDKRPPDGDFLPRSDPVRGSAQSNMSVSSDQQLLPSSMHKNSTQIPLSTNYGTHNRKYVDVDYQTEEDYANSIRNAGVTDIPENNPPDKPPRLKPQLSEEEARRMLSDGCFHDDDTTTMSGSYTISAEELCNQIDDLFFKPDLRV